MQAPLAAVLVAARADQLLAGDVDGVQLALDLRDPEIEELVQLGIAGRDIVMLPDERLEDTRMVGQVVGDVGRREAITVELQFKE